MKYVVVNGNIHEYQEGKYENAVIFPTIEEAQEYVKFKNSNKLDIIKSDKETPKVKEYWKKQYKNYLTLEERLKFRNYLETGDKSSITEKDINRLRNLMHNGDEIISKLEYTEEEYRNQPKELLDPEFEKFEAWKKKAKENGGYTSELSIKGYLQSESGRVFMCFGGRNLMFRELDKIVSLPEDTNEIHYINDKDLHKLRVLIGDEVDESKKFNLFYF
jgi:hypothetical protein